jgi:hypothetical protein
MPLIDKVFMLTIVAGVIIVLAAVAYDLWSDDWTDER